MANIAQNAGGLNHGIRNGWLFRQDTIHERNNQKSGLIKILHPMKGIVKKMRRKSTYREHIIRKDTSDKEFLFKIHK